MVDRQYIIEMLGKIRNPNMTLSIMTGIIREYCLEKGKQEKDVDTLISVLTQPNPISNAYLLEKYYSQALEYYMKKFNVYALSFNSQVILYY